MATRDVGAKDLAPATTGAGLAPGAVTATGLQAGGLGFAALTQLASGEPLTDSGGGNWNAGPIDVRAIQTRLREFGYNIRVDGVWGPKSQAAWTDFTGKGGSMTTAPAAGGAGGGGGGDAAGGSPSPSDNSFSLPPTPAVPGNPSERYPEMAALLSVPTIRWLLTRAVNEGWTPEKLGAEVRATDWWRTTPPTKRAFIALEAQDPMAAAQQVAETRESVRKLRDAYMVDMSDDALSTYARQIASGEQDALAFQKELVEQAKGKFPSLAASLDQGMTTRQLWDPYAKMAADELEITQNGIDPNDPKWTRALQGSSPDGKPTKMTLYDWQRVLRTEETYGYDRTSAARQQAANLATQLQKTFGRL